MPHAADKKPPATAGAIPPGQEEHGGQRFALQADGSLLPLAMIKPADQMRDDMVRDQIARAEEVSASLSRFKASSLEEADVLLDVLASQYKVSLGGKKGNVVFETMDGTLRVQIAVADRITFGPELQIAKALVDECLREWGAESRPEIQAIVQNAFRVDKEGQLNHGALLGLKRLNITDERWLRAMQAITDSMKVVGSKRYIRFHKRENAEAAWVAIPTSLSDA